MEPKRRQLYLLAALAVVLLGAAAYRFWPSTAARTPATSNSKTGKKGKAGQASVDAPDVHLEALNAPRPEPEAANRNLFRFKPKPPPPPPPAPPPRPATPSTPVPSGPPPPPPLPPIPLKFAGLVQQGSGPKAAILVDAVGHTMYAKEGDIVEGRYKIWRIGVESIDISYLDGRGRTSIRIGGS